MVTAVLRGTVALDGTACERQNNTKLVHPLACAIFRKLLKRCSDMLKRIKIVAVGATVENYKCK